MARGFLYKADEVNIMWVHTYEGYVNSDGGVPVTASASTMFDPSTTIDYLYAVEFNIVNQDTSNAVVVTVALDPTGGTVIAAPGIVYNNQTIAAAAESGWQGPYVTLGTTTWNAVAGAANDAVFFYRARVVRDPTVSIA
jgi:hypothetical protein